MTKVTEHIVLFLIQAGVIKDEEKEIYIYGLHYILYNTFICLTFIIMSFIFDQLVETIVFILVCGLLRGSAGGYHASNYFRCFLTSLFVYFFIMFFSSYLAPMDLNKISLIFIIVGNIILFLIAPTQNLVNPKTSDKLKKNRKKMVFILLVLNCISVTIFMSNNFNEKNFVICSTILTVAILNIINLIQGKSHYEKRKQISKFNC